MKTETEIRQKLLHLNDTIREYKDDTDYLAYCSIMEAQHRILCWVLKK